MLVLISFFKGSSSGARRWTLFFSRWRHRVEAPVNRWGQLFLASIGWHRKPNFVSASLCKHPCKPISEKKTRVFPLKHRWKHLRCTGPNSFPDKPSIHTHDVWLYTVNNIDDEEYQQRHSRCHHSLPKINSVATPIASGPPLRRMATASSFSFHRRSPMLSFLSTLRSTSCNQQGAHSTTSSRKPET